MLSNWALTKIECLADKGRILIRDPLQLLPELDGLIHTFARGKRLHGDRGLHQFDFSAVVRNGHCRP